MIRDDTAKKKLLARLRRAEGQLAAVRRMVDEDDYCVDTLLQISATCGALNKVGQILLESHIENCVSHAFATGDAKERKRKVDELMDVFARYGSVGK